jgi:hypothetical protein
MIKSHLHSHSYDTTSLTPVLQLYSHELIIVLYFCLTLLSLLAGITIIPTAITYREQLHLLNFSLSKIHFQLMYQL